MATAFNVLPFPSKSNTTGGTSSGLDNQPKIRTLKDEDAKSEQPTDIAIDDLYPVSDATAPELDVALRLLAKGLSYLNEAYNANVAGNDIAGDDAIHRLQSVMPELFNCRMLGDGYGAIINAVMNSLQNRKGVLLTQSQIDTIRKVLHRLRREPFIKFSDAMDEVEKLEEANFTIEPAGFDALADWLDG